MEWQQARNEPLHWLDVNLGSIELWYNEGNDTYSIIAAAGSARLRESGIPTLEAAQQRALAFYVAELQAEIARVPNAGASCAPR